MTVEAVGTTETAHRGRLASGDRYSERASRASQKVHFGRAELGSEIALCIIQVAV
jgi:hypothetical protein